MKRKKKQLLSLALAVLMTVGLLPMGALADQEISAVETTAVQSQSTELPEFTSASTETTIGDAAATDGIVVAEDAMVTAKSNTGSLVSLLGGCLYSEAYQVLERINQERQKNGLNPVTVDTKLNEAAMQRAAECAVYFSHTRPTGEDCFSVLSEYGISVSAAGENIAAGQDSAEAVMDSWMNSEEHRANILNPNYTTVGIGCFLQYDDMPCWVQVFADGEGDDASQPKDTGHIAYVRVSEDYLGEMMVSLEKNKLAAGMSTQTTVVMVNLGQNNIIWFPESDCLTYRSSKSAVATVSSHGGVKTKSKGTTQIVVQLYGMSRSASKKLTVTRNIADAKITGLEVSNQKNDIKVKWNKLALAKKYEIYRSTAGGSYKKVKTTTSTSWKDTNVTNGTKYKYKVYGVRGSKRSSASSKSMIRLTRVTIRSVAQADSGVIQVTWKRNKKADGYYISIYSDGNVTEGNLDKVYQVPTNQYTVGRFADLPSGEQITVRMTAYKKSGTKIYQSGISAGKTVIVP